MCAAAQIRTDILGKRPNVGALAALDEQADRIPLEPLQLEPADRDAPGGARNVLAAARVSVQGPAAIFDRRILRRQLLDLASMAIECGEQLLAAYFDFSARNHRTLGIAGLGALAEPQLRAIALVRIEYPAGKLGRFAQHNDEQAACERVERSRMARTRGPEQALRSLQYRIRARSCRLVDEQHPVDWRVRVSHGSSIRFLSGDCRIDQLRETRASLDRSVVHEAYFGGDAESQAPPELNPQESRRAIETRLDRR